MSLWPISKRSLSDEIKETVTLFYCSDDVSYQMHGKEDCVVIKKNCVEGLKNKSHVQLGICSCHLVKLMVLFCRPRLVY